VVPTWWTFRWPKGQHYGGADVADIRLA
jgi:hypothetical protein